MSVFETVLISAVLDIRYSSSWCRSKSFSVYLTFIFDVSFVFSAVTYIAFSMVWAIVVIPHQKYLLQLQYDSDKFVSANIPELPIWEKWTIIGIISEGYAGCISQYIVAHIMLFVFLATSHAECSNEDNRFCKHWMCTCNIVMQDEIQLNKIR